MLPNDPQPSAQETIRTVFVLAQEGRLGYSDMLAVTKLLVNAGNQALATSLYQLWLAHTASPLTHNAHLEPEASQTAQAIQTVRTGPADIGRPLPANISCGIDIDAICAAHDAGGHDAAVAEVRARLGVRDDAIAAGVVQHSLKSRGANLYTALLFCSRLGSGEVAEAPGA